MTELLYTIRISMTKTGEKPAIQTEVEGTDALNALLRNFEEFPTVNKIFVNDIEKVAGNLLCNLHVLEHRVKDGNNEG